MASFGRPTEEELAHDYLWRVHHHTPGAGEMVIFNRSHYEDVLVVRVHGLVPEAVWSRRYHQINECERLLAEEGTTILKFFLHISPEEQAERLAARRDDPTKRWKFSLGDLDERRRWSDYMAAYEEVLSRTSTPWAPWYVVPADRKWYRNLVVATALVDGPGGPPDGLSGARRGRLRRGHPTGGVKRAGCRRRPRIQSPAAMRLRPSGCTSTSSTGPSAVPEQDHPLLHRRGHSRLRPGSPRPAGPATA